MTLTGMMPPFRPVTEMLCTVPPPSGIPIFASALASYAASHLHTAGVANAAAVHGYTTAFWWSVGIFALSFVLAVVILPGPVKPRVPTLRAALARHAIGNCHHFEPKDGDRQALGATTGAGVR